jgi:hypothetical protein
MPFTIGNTSQHSTTSVALIRRLDGSVTPFNPAEFDQAQHEVIQAVMPLWLKEFYDTLVDKLARMEQFLFDAYQHQENASAYFPLLVQGYRQLLQQQHNIFDNAARNPNALAEATYAKFQSMELQCREFAASVEAALVIVADRSSSQYEALRQLFNQQLEAQQVAHQEYRTGRQSDRLEIDALTNALNEAARASAGHRFEVARTEEELRKKLTAQSNKAVRLSKEVEALKQSVMTANAESEKIQVDWGTKFDEFKTKMLGFVNQRDRSRVIDIARSVTSGNQRQKSTVAPPLLFAPPPSVAPSDASYEEMVGEPVMHGARAEASAPPARSAINFQSPPPLPPRPGSPARSTSPPPRNHHTDMMVLGRPKKRAMTEPVKFKGTRTENFREWFRYVKNFFRYERDAFSTDFDKIQWISGRLEGAARRWFDTREVKLERENREGLDTWLAFEADLKARFVDEQEQRRALQKMRDIRYNKDVRDYLSQLDHLNGYIMLSGTAWQEILLDGLPSDFKDQMAPFRSPFMSDTELIDLITRVGVRAEDRAREKEIENRRRPDKPAATSNQSRRNNKPEDKTPVSDANRPTPKDKVVKTESKGSPQQQAVRTQTDKDAAHKGIPENLREARRKRSLCTRCGKPNHWWGECRGQIIVAAISQKFQSRISEVSPEPEPVPDAGRSKRRASEPLEQEDDKKRSRVSAATRYFRRHIYDDEDNRL